MKSRHNGLDEYAIHSADFFVTNREFYFLSGHHHLSRNMTLKDVHSIQLRSDTGRESDVVIDSEPTVSLIFEFTNDTVIRGIGFKTTRLKVIRSMPISLSETASFEGSREGAVIVIYSNLHITGTVVFRNNSNVHYAGGAILAINSDLFSYIVTLMSHS